MSGAQGAAADHEEHTMETATNLPAIADDAATMVDWSDRRACTIIARSARKITVQRDHAELVNADELQVSPGGFCAHVEGRQRYTYTRDTEGAVATYTLRKNGRWVRTGCPANTRGASLIVGERAEHYDYNF